jgi:hypothetical protein
VQQLPSTLENGSVKLPQLPANFRPITLLAPRLDPEEEKKKEKKTIQNLSGTSNV